MKQEQWIYHTLKQFNHKSFCLFSGNIIACLGLASENRILDVCYMFLILWYYCTLTIRESILRVNGTRIRVSIYIFDSPNLNIWCYVSINIPEFLSTYIEINIPFRVGGERITLSRQFLVEFFLCGQTENVFKLSGRK